MDKPCAASVQPWWSSPAPDFPQEVFLGGVKEGGVPSGMRVLEGTWLLLSPVDSGAGVVSSMWRRGLRYLRMFTGLEGRALCRHGLCCKYGI